MTVISIDPGTCCGVAKFDGGKLVMLVNMNPLELFLYLLENAGRIGLVVIEDSRMISHVYTGSKENRAVALNMARKVGQVDRLCSMVEDYCIDHKKPFISISPKQKGAKVGSKDFKRITGWDGRTSEHMRDAAMVGWNYRHGAKVAA